MGVGAGSGSTTGATSLIRPSALRSSVSTLAADVGIVLQELAGVLAALADALALVAVPGAALLDDVLRHAEIDQIAFFRDAFAVDDVELGFAERRRHLVLDDLHLGAVADHDLAILDGGDAADVDADRE